MVIVEQPIQRALDIAEDVILMDRGRTAWIGGARDLQERPELIDRDLGVSWH